VSDWLLAVSTIAASVAALFSWRAVRDARKFHKEQERDADRERLAAAVRALTDAAIEAHWVHRGDRPGAGALRAYHARFRAELEATGRRLERCEAVAEVPIPDDDESNRSDRFAVAKQIEDLAPLAFGELHQAIVSMAPMPRAILRRAIKTQPLSTKSSARVLRGRREPQAPPQRD
jgi:hypothetical protein